MINYWNRIINRKNNIKYLKVKIDFPKYSRHVLKDKVTKHILWTKEKYIDTGN